MHTPADAWRRWFGVFFLTLAAGLLVWGQTVLKPHLKGLAFVLYWLTCFALTGLALFVALLDIRVMRKRTQEAHRDLMKKTLLQPPHGGSQAPGTSSDPAIKAKSGVH